MEQVSQQVPPVSHQPVKTSDLRSKFPLIIGVLFFLFLAIGAAFFLGQRYGQIGNLSQGNVVPSFTPTIEPIPSTIPTNVAVIKTNKEGIKNEIESFSNPKMMVEALDVSPVDSSIIAYLGHNEQWNKFGVYFYDSSTKQSKTIYETTQDLGGRGGYYLDKVALEFSPSGEAFYVNRTGLNFPVLFIISSDGKILYKSAGDVGHATWLTGQKLLHIINANEKPKIYDVGTNGFSTSALPEKIFHFKANHSGTRILALSLPKNGLQCESFDLHIYSYPESIDLKTVPNVDLKPNWVDNNTVSYQKVTGCKKNEEEAMFEFSALTETQQVVIQ